MNILEVSRNSIERPNLTARLGRLYKNKAMFLSKKFGGFNIYVYLCN